MIYELRHYVPARGKKDAVAARIREHSAKLLQRLGFKVVQSWEAADGSGEIWYVLEYRDMDDLKASTDRFINDPEWKRLKAETEQEGALYEKIEAFPLVTSTLFA
jgi:hypothetical protein